MRKLLSLLFLVTVVFAGNTGKITGKITDVKTGDPLVGANIILVGTLMGAASDLDGNFFILNIPPGTYDLESRMIGYANTISKGIRVKVDLTTPINIAMKSSVVEGETVEIIAEKPAVQMDQTSSQQTYSAEELINLPVESVENAVALAAGAVEENGVLHFRGGRQSETVYLFDGISLNDPLTGNPNDSNVPMLGVGELSVITGGFTAEYGNAQSGVINLSSAEGNNSFHSNVRFTTSAVVNDTFNDSDPEKQDKFEFSFSGPIVKDLMTFSFSGEYDDDSGRLANQWADLENYSGKITLNPMRNLKVSVSGLYSKKNFQDGYSHLYSRNVDEDLLWSYSPDNDASDPAFHSWYNNGQVDTEDTNLNGILDIDLGEDLNNDEVLQSEDIDFNNALTYYTMFDRQPWYQTKSDLLNGSLTYTFSSKSYFTFQFASYNTKQTMNVIENLNEDQNFNGILDDGEDLNGNGFIDAYNPNVTIHGINDSHDMFTDWNNNDYVDQSEGTFDNNGDGVIDKADWFHWKDIPSEGQKVQDFYAVSPCHQYTYNRDAWHYDKKVTNTLKAEYVSQIDLHNKINIGVDMKYYKLTNHDAPDRYGYAENYTVEPTDWAFFVMDKMEYKGIVVNAGLRAEYFDPNETLPADETDPTWESTDFDDWDGDGISQPYNADFTDNYIHELGDVKNPVTANSKFVFAPRLGISHPITDHSKLYFNYGRYYQRPQLNYLFRNRGFNLGGGFPIIGNPDLNPELTVSYEVGVQNEVSRGMIVELKGFYKDIYGLTDTRPVYWTVNDWYTTYENRDYGNVRGAEFIFAVRPPGMFYGQVNYTYTIAKGKSSSVGQGYLTNWAGGIVPTFESYLDWDQTHTFNADVNFSYRGFLATMVLSGGSGTRYTEPGQGRLIVENTLRLPGHIESDVKLNYMFRLGTINANLFMTVTNLFDRKNIRYVDDVEWYHQYKTINDKYDNGDLTREEWLSFVDPDEFNDTDGIPNENKIHPEMGKNLNPAVYGDSRRFRIGVTFDF